jgi:hypothetical protein
MVDSPVPCVHAKKWLVDKYTQVGKKVVSPLSILSEEEVPMPCMTISTQFANAEGADTHFVETRIL